MRKNKTSKYTFKLAVAVIGAGATIAAISATDANGNVTASDQLAIAQLQKKQDMQLQEDADQRNRISSSGNNSGSTVGQIAGQAQNVTDQAGNSINNSISAMGGSISNVMTGGSTQSSVNTNGSSAITPVIDNPSSEEMKRAGCDAGVWAKMVSEYNEKANRIIALDTEQLVRQVVKATPPISSMASCFDQAANIINSATAIYTTITKILTGGGLDSNQLLAFGKNLMTKYACNLMNNYIASTGISGTLNGINNIPNQVLGTNVGVGGINTSVGGILQGGGYQQGQGSVGQVTSGQVAGAVSDMANQVKIPGIN